MDATTGSTRVFRARAWCPAAWVAAALVALATSCTEQVELEPSEPAGGGATGGPVAAAVPAPVDTVVPVVSDDHGLPVKTPDGWLRGTPLPPERHFTLDSYRWLLKREFGLYPVRLIRQIGLKKVVLCQELRFEGAECYSFADVERGCLYLSALAGFDKAHVTRTFHHELFHQIDFADDHRLDTDPAWESLNPPGFRYSHSSVELQLKPDAVRPDESVPGFLNRYAASNPAEDKAEVFSALMVDREQVRRRTLRDEILRRKVERIRATLAAFGPHARNLIVP